MYAMLFLAAPPIGLWLLFKIVLAAIACFCSPWFGWSPERQWVYIPGGLALFTLLIILIFGM